MSNLNQNRLSLIYAGLSDIGMVRQDNQDSYLKLPENNSDLYNGKGQLFIVADGVGGHTGGKEASRMAVEIIGDHFNSAEINKAVLKKAFEEANAQIYEKARKSTEFNNMATTCSALFLKESTGIIAHVGDSRVYKINGNHIKQLTADHTQVQELLRKGVLKKEEIDSYPNKSVLVRAMGAEPNIEVDMHESIDLSDDQYFILCSDGLGKVKENELISIVTGHPPDTACKILISLANERGGKDNVTVQVIKLQAEKKLNIKPKKPKSVLYIILIASILIAAAAVLFSSQKAINHADSVKTDTLAVNHLNNDDSGITRADELFERGKIEGALSIYKNILESEPMDLKAIKGINKVADHYFQKAEKLRKSGSINAALRLYYKVNEIRPEHEMSNYYIKLYRNRINLSPGSAK